MVRVFVRIENCKRYLINTDANCGFLESNEGWRNMIMCSSTYTYRSACVPSKDVAVDSYPLNVVRHQHGAMGTGIYQELNLAYNVRTRRCAWHC